MIGIFYNDTSVVDQGSMGATSAGLGCGTTVYFELPLFSAATAGKLPTAPSMADYPLQSQASILGNASPNHSIERDRARLLDEVMSTPERTKPCPCITPLTGSAIHIVDATTTDEDGASPSPRLRNKPMQGMPR